MPETEAVTAALLIIGNEILSGRTQDANLQYIAKGLGDIGVRLREVRVIPDVDEVIVETLNTCRAAYDYVFTTGGIGPTHDDITATAVARAFGLRIERNAQAVAIMDAQYEHGQLNEARLKMADMPVGSELVLNPVSGAPGFRVENVYVMAGVPGIMRAMFDEIKNELRGGPPMLSRAVTTNLPEGAIAEGLGALQERYPNIDIGSYPFYRKRCFGVSLVLRGIDAEVLARATTEALALVESLGGEGAEESLEDGD
jgi:molybdenum cofactor synthesis domain-containing protein